MESDKVEEEGKDEQIALPETTNDDPGILTDSGRGDEGVLEGVAIRGDDSNVSDGTSSESDDEQIEGITIHAGRASARRTYNNRSATKSYHRPQPLGIEITTSSSSYHEIDTQREDDLKKLRFLHQKTAFDVDIEGLEVHPWRNKNVDILDYFNYGFNEKTWMIYCEKQLRRRAELGLGPHYYQPVNKVLPPLTNSTNNLIVDTIQTPSKIEITPKKEMITVSNPSTTVPTSMPVGQQFSTSDNTIHATPPIPPAARQNIPVNPPMVQATINQPFVANSQINRTTNMNIPMPPTNLQPRAPPPNFPTGGFVSQPHMNAAFPPPFFPQYVQPPPVNMNMQFQGIPSPPPWMMQPRTASNMNFQPAPGNSFHDQSNQRMETVSHSEHQNHFPPKEGSKSEEQKDEINVRSNKDENEKRNNQSIEHNRSRDKERSNSRGRERDGRRGTGRGNEREIDKRDDSRNYRERSRDGKRNRDDDSKSTFESKSSRSRRETDYDRDRKYDRDNPRDDKYNRRKSRSRSGGRYDEKRNDRFDDRRKRY